MVKMYENAGVNLNEADLLHNKLKTFKNNNIGLFAGFSPLPNGETGIIACCDGIGSKVVPLYQRGLYRTIAVDLIAANLNDLICENARAIGFMDYIAVNKLDNNAIYEIVRHLNTELAKYGCTLLGGETSELRAVMKDDCIDISGFAIGHIKERLPKNITKGDYIIGLPSSGIHANGFSLINQLYQDKKLNEEDFNTCLTESFVYYNEVKILYDSGLIKASANITGGGILSNLNRIIPEELSVRVDFSKIPTQPIFTKLKSICGEELYDVFNAGVGFCLIADKEHSDKVFEICKQYTPFILGEVV